MAQTEKAMDGRTALVTGGSKGIESRGGRAVAIQADVSDLAEIERPMR